MKKLIIQIFTITTLIVVLNYIVITNQNKKHPLYAVRTPKLSDDTAKGYERMLEMKLLRSGGKV